MSNHILTLDVGFANMGWMVLKNHQPVEIGVIQTDKSKSKTTRTADDYSTRSAQLALGLEHIIKKYDVKGIVGELPHGGAQNARAASMMSMSNAIVSVVGALLRLPMEWTTPNEVKIALSGKRNATKEEQMENCLLYLEKRYLLP